MSKQTLCLLLLLFLYFTLTSSTKLTSSTSTTDFIKTSCKCTQFPDLCFKSLASYAPMVHKSTRQLALAALTVSSDRARTASNLVNRFMSTGGNQVVRSRDKGAVQDCLDNMADSVDRLKQSAKELNRLGRSGSTGFAWHLSNVQTWCSAALTDENTCLDSLNTYASPAVRSKIREKVVEVAQVTSNALALVNRIS